MKIEVNCLHCDALLRVDAIHAGKQLRCPTCNHLSPIPVEGIPTPESGSAAQGNGADGEVGAETDPVANPASRFSQPLADTQLPQPEYLNPIAPARPSEGQEALVFGILGIVLNIGCGCLFPILFVLNLFGLYLSFKASRYRMAAIVTNAIALLMSGFWLLMAFWR